MSFEQYRDKVVADFQEDCKSCKMLDRDLTSEDIKMIKDGMEEHRECYNTQYQDYCNDDEALFVICIYGENESASIECKHCNVVIIDDNALNEIE